MTSILRPLRVGSLAALKACGVFGRIRDSRWRTQRLLILCYHGLSIDEEHLWRPATYIAPQLFQQRLEVLAQHHYQVLQSDDAIKRLYSGNLPPRSVVITFDDGTYDFYAHA